MQSDLKYQHFRQFSHFRDNYLSHSVLSQFAQTLVWAVFESVEKNGKTYKKFCHAFLPNNDGSWLNHDYDDIKPIIEKMVSDSPNEFFTAPLHPAFISEEEQQAYGDMIMDFEILQPCPQLSIQAYRATENEWQQGEINRFDNVELYKGSIGDFYYRYSFNYLYDEKQRDPVGFQAVHKEGEHLNVYFASDYSDNTGRFQIQPIKIDKETNKFLLNNVLEILTQAQNVFKK